METVAGLDILQDRIRSESMVLVYLSRPDCGVCRSLKPKVMDLLVEYPGITSYYVDLDENPAAAGEYSVFTIPGILVFVDGKETVREARYVSVEQLDRRIGRIYDLRFGQ